MSEHGVEWQEVYDLKEVASLVDVLYMTRIQKERFTCMEEYAKAKGKYICDKELMKSLGKKAVVMHPLPRVDEVGGRGSGLWGVQGLGTVACGV